jgi:hypothetical protein
LGNSKLVEGAPFQVKLELNPWHCEQGPIGDCADERAEGINVIEVPSNPAKQVIDLSTTRGDSLIKLLWEAGDYHAEGDE